MRTPAGSQEERHESTADGQHLEPRFASLAEQIRRLISRQRRARALGTPWICPQVAARRASNPRLSARRASSTVRRMLAFDPAAIRALTLRLVACPSVSPD